MDDGTAYGSDQDGGDYPRSGGNVKSFRPDPV
jgi:hypothetical protein